VSNNSAPTVIRFAAFGDVVLLTVLLQRLCERYGQPVALLSSGGWTRTLLEHDPAVSEIKIVKSRKTPYWFDATQQEAVKWLRSRTGPVYLCDPDPHARRLVERAVPTERIHRLWDAWPGLDVHWADWWESVGTQTTIVEGSGQPRLHVPDEWLIDARAWMRTKSINENKFVLIQPGNKKTAKRWSWNRKNDKFWPEERWIETIQGVLSERSDFHVIVCGSPSESALVDGIVAACRDERVLAAANDLPIPRLAGLAALAHSMISIDTGPAHLAAAMDCPSVVLFGVFGWGRWAPRAPHSTVIPLGHRETNEHAHVDQIDVEQVLNAWRTLPLRAFALSHAHAENADSTELSSILLNTVRV
jgi:heptosyltransferase III